MTVLCATVLESLAPIFQYPRADYNDRVANCRAALATGAPELLPNFDAFAAAIRALPLAHMEELFTQTFDLSPLCCLEVGWHLFGENYERGEFLVKVRQDLRNHGIPESAELPDHLSHVLALLARLPGEDAAVFAARFAAPALEKMQEGLKGAGNGFENLVRTAAAAVGGGQS